MAQAKHIFEDGFDNVNLNVPGDDAFVLKLDRNEAEAILHYIRSADDLRGPKMKERRTTAATTGHPPATSLCASAIRVYDALNGPFERHWDKG